MDKDSFVFLFLYFAILSLFFIAAPANAYKLLPLEANLTSVGEKASTEFQIINDKPYPIAVELMTYQREMDVDGQDWLTEDDDNFIIYPQQLILMPAQSKAIRVKYIGKPDLSEEKSFRLISEQLPIALNDEEDSEGGGMKFLIRYVASIYITPSNNAKPDVSLSAVEQEDGGKAFLYLTNKGNEHTILNKFSLNNGMTNEDLPSISGTLILAGATRRFPVPELSMEEAKLMLNTKIILP